MKKAGKKERTIRNITFFVLFLYIFFANKKIRIIMFTILLAFTLFMFFSLVINSSLG